MTTNRYFIRALKSTALFFVLAALVFVLSFALGNSADNPITFEELLRGSDLLNLAIFGVVFGAVYPLFGYVTRKVHVRLRNDGEHDDLDRLFADVRFELLSDDGEKLIFRQKNPVTRLMRLYEDRIEVDYSENPVALRGLRRDVDRLVARLRWLAQNESK
jgi:uncharacterized membrane protein YciS (DUF1049 family)